MKTKEKMSPLAWLLGIQDRYRLFLRMHCLHHRQQCKVTSLHVFHSIYWHGRLYFGVLEE
jgi:hypothetical protein